MRFSLLSSIFVAAGFGLVGAAGAQTARVTPPPEASAGAPVVADTSVAAADPAADYILGPNDVLEVSVIGRDDFKARVRVQTDGTIQLPLIETVKAADKTTLVLADEIRAKLVAGGYFSKPAVTVEIVSFVTRYVTVLGEVAQPGLVPIDRPYRVSEIIARVGGVRDNGSDVITLRRVAGAEQQLSLKTLATGTGNEDPMIEPGDKLYVPTAQTFYIYGQVAAPGNYKLERTMSLRMAIARGGGLTAAGSEKRTKVYRAGALVNGLGLNDQLQAGDVVVVGERFF